ncbi:phosphotransferase [Virgibacillus oceani]
MVDWLKRVLGNDWDVTPAGGLTGDAYLAAKNEERLFLKRNSSPFLAVLSAEEIVPKLIWTKRMENGDVITAQEWVEGRELKQSEMREQKVAELIRKIHDSQELLYMLMRLGKTPLSAHTQFEFVKKRLDSSNLINGYHEVHTALLYLEELLQVTEEQTPVVCHGDLNHNNLLMAKEDNLYLVDWDNARIADPVVDFGMVLKWYIPKEEWNDWLKKYGLINETNLYERMYWYLMLDTLQYVSWHSERNEPFKVTERLRDLQELNVHVKSFILG